MIRTLGFTSLAAVGLFAAACFARDTSFSTLEDGSHVFGGEFHNTSTAAVLFPKVKVEFRDSGGEVVDTQTVPTCLRALAAQQGRGPFEAVSDETGASSASASLVVEQATNDELAGAGQIRIAVDEVALSGSTVAVQGTVTLQEGGGAVPVDDLRVCIAVVNAPADDDDFVDRAGPITRVVPVSLGDAEPGDEIDFDAAIEVPSGGSDDGYHLDLYADALVDETPIAPRSLPDVPVE